MDKEGTRKLNKFFKLVGCDRKTSGKISRKLKIRPHKKAFEKLANKQKIETIIIKTNDYSVSEMSTLIKNKSEKFIDMHVFTRYKRKIKSPERFIDLKFKKGSGCVISKNDEEGTDMKYNGY